MNFKGLRLSANEEDSLRGLLAGGGVAAMTNRPANRIVSFYGDSRVSNGILVAGTNYSITARSIIGWARDLAKQSFIFDIGNVHAFGGANSEQVLALLRADIDADPAGTVAVLCGTNDRATPYQWAASRTIDALEAIEALILDRGKLCLWLTEMPRGGSNALSGADLAAHLSVVRWLNGRRAVPGVHVVDTFTPLTDLASATAAPLTNMMGSDGLHPAPIGAYTAGLAIKAKMDTLFSSNPELALGAADLYDATNNPRGSLNANPMMTGTGGTVNNGAATVTNNGAAANWTIDFLNATGLSCTLAKVSSGGKDWQQFTLSGTPTAASPSIRIASTASISSSIALGDLIEQTGEAEINASQTGVLSIQMEAILSSMNRRDMHSDVNWPADALSMSHKIGPVAASAFETGFYKPNYTIVLAQNVAVSAVIRVRALAARKVT